MLSSGKEVQSIKVAEKSTLQISDSGLEFLAAEMATAFTAYIFFKDLIMAMKA